MYFLFGPWTPFEQSRVRFFQTTVTASLYTYVLTYILFFGGTCLNYKNILCIYIIQ